MLEIAVELFRMLGVELVPTEPLTMVTLLPYILAVIVAFTLIIYCLDMVKYFCAIVFRGGSGHV